MENDNLKEKMKELDRNKATINFKDKKYDPEKLLAEIVKSHKVKLDPKIAFHADHFDQSQFKADGFTKLKTPAVMLFEGKYVVIYAPENMPHNTFKDVYLVSTFNMKKAKWISLEERTAIYEANQQAEQEQQNEAARSHWGQKKPYNGSNRFSSTPSSHQHFGAPKPRFNGRGR